MKLNLQAVAQIGMGAGIAMFAIGPIGGLCSAVSLFAASPFVPDQQERNLMTPIPYAFMLIGLGYTIAQGSETILGRLVDRQYEQKVEFLRNARQTEQEQQLIERIASKRAAEVLVEEMASDDWLFDEAIADGAELEPLTVTEEDPFDSDPILAPPDLRFLEECSSCQYWVGSPYLRCTAHPMGLDWNQQSCDNYRAEHN